MSKILSIDFDEVLYNLSDVTNNFILETYGEVTHPDLIGWEYFNDNFPLVVSECWNNEHVYSKGELIDGAENFMLELINLYSVDNLQIVTNSLPNVVNFKNKFIKDKFGNIDVIHTKEKWKYTKDTILIDDAIHNVIDHSEINNCESILFDKDGKYVWNHVDIDNRLITRLKSYEDILYFLTN